MGGSSGETDDVAVEFRRRVGDIVKLVAEQSSVETHAREREAEEGEHAPHQGVGRGEVAMQQYLQHGLELRVLPMGKRLPGAETARSDAREAVFRQGGEGRGRKGEIEAFRGGVRGQARERGQRRRRRGG